MFWYVHEGVHPSTHTNTNTHGKGIRRAFPPQIPPTLKLFRDSPGDTEEESQTAEEAT